MSESDSVGTGAHLTPSELALWTALLDAGRILDTELERDLVAHHAMTHREYEVLVRLDGHGGRMRMSQLASHIEASSPLVTQTVRRLEDRGWVERVRASDDGRGVEAALTPVGGRALAAAADPHAALVRSLLLDLVGDDDLDQVAIALTRVADHLRVHRREGRCTLDDDACPIDAAAKK